MGAPFAAVNGLVDAGAVYVYETSTGALVSTLTEPTPGLGDSFGYSVAISGSTVVVGSPDSRNVSGNAYVFDATTGSLSAHTAEREWRIRVFRRGGRKRDRRRSALSDHRGRYQRRRSVRLRLGRRLGGPRPPILCTGVGGTIRLFRSGSRTGLLAVGSPGFNNGRGRVDTFLSWRRASLEFHGTVGGAGGRPELRWRRRQGSSWSERPRRQLRRVRQRPSLRLQHQFLEPGSRRHPAAAVAESRRVLRQFRGDLRDHRRGCGLRRQRGRRRQRPRLPLQLHELLLHDRLARRQVGGAVAGNERRIRLFRGGVGDDGRRRCARQQRGRVRRWPNLRLQRRDRGFRRRPGRAGADDRRRFRRFRRSLGDDCRGRCP